MEKHIEFEALNILIDKVTEIENGFLVSDDFHSWLEKQSDTDKAVYSDRIFKVSIYRSKLQNMILVILLDEFNKIVPQLNEGVTNLQRETQETKDFIKAMKTLDKVLGLVARVVTVAAVPSVASLAIAKEVMNARSARDITRRRKLFLSAESHAMLPQSFAEEETAFAPLEEVLYKVELTPAKLIITVDAGLDRSVEVIFRNKLNS
jgi:hypothetical protein